MNGGMNMGGNWERIMESKEEETNEVAEEEREVYEWRKAGMG